MRFFRKMFMYEPHEFANIIFQLEEEMKVKNIEEMYLPNYVKKDKFISFLQQIKSVYENRGDEEDAMPYLCQEAITAINNNNKFDWNYFIDVAEQCERGIIF